MLNRGGRAEGFCIMKPHRDFDQDSGDSGVILWRGDDRGGEWGKIMWQPTAEPAPHTLVCAQQEGNGRDPQGLHCDHLEERKDVVAIDFDIVYHIVHCHGFIRRLVVHLVIHVLPV